MSGLGKRVARWRARREREAWQRVTARMRRRDGTAILQGEVWRLRDMSAATWWLLIRWRPVQFARLLRDVFDRWAVMPGDRVVNPILDLHGEVLAVSRDHVLLKVWPRWDGWHRADGPWSTRSVPRDLVGWWRA